jgi:hypothetical protein
MSKIYRNKLMDPGRKFWCDIEDTIRYDKAIKRILKENRRKGSMAFNLFKH